ncbi:OB-fold domain-containing protein, partial [Amycolatopsis sp. NPDC003676]
MTEDGTPASGRPLPQLGPDNEFFWTAGADGVLRIQECHSCAALLHPPQPVCRYCRGSELGVRELSGRATLIAYTVNHRFAVPGLDPPYVVATVAPVEDTRVRLTTNIVAAEPDSLELGMPVEVTFQPDGDVWLPLFRPVAGEPVALPVDEIAPDGYAARIRPMVRGDKFEDRVALTGIGMSQIGRRLMVPALSLTVAACERAVADAGLTFDDIDGLSSYPGGGNLGGFGEGGVTALEAALGIRPTWHNGGIETFGPGGSVIAAMTAVAAGLARHVLCFRTVWESTFAEQMKAGRITPGGGRTASWLTPFGATSAAHTLAQKAQRHFHDYGTTRETLGWIALNQRANAALDPSVNTHEAQACFCAAACSSPSKVT